MRKTSSFKIDGRDDPVVVNELTVRQIIGLGKTGEKAFTSTDGMRDFLESDFLRKVTNLSYDELLDMSPSEIDTVWAKFVEVNQSFFDFAAKAGLLDLWERLKAAVLSDFLRLQASSLKRGTLESSTTGSPSSSTP